METEENITDEETMNEENITEEVSFKKKEFTYRGKSVEDLKKMEIREFANLLKSNEKRTILRQTNELQKFISRCNKKISEKKQIKTHSRYLIIVPQLIGMRILIHKGNTFVPLEVTAEMLGHRLGEFATTRMKVKHGAAGVGATRGSASMSVK
ncbi:MAG: ribosomal protein S19 family protein [Candidatus Pacearchaeota archaeon]|jgi:small subunit ribosomal protein S19